MIKGVASTCLVTLFLSGCSCPATNKAVSKTERREEPGSDLETPRNVSRVALVDRGHEYKLPIAPVADILGRLIRVCEPPENRFVKAKTRAVFLVDTPELSAIVPLYRCEPGLIRHAPLRAWGPEHAWIMGASGCCGVPDADHARLIEIVATTVATQTGRMRLRRRVYTDCSLPRDPTRILLDYAGKEYVAAVEPLVGIVARVLGKEVEFCRRPGNSEMIARLTIEGPETKAVFIIYEGYTTWDLRFGGGIPPTGEFCIPETHRAELHQAIEAVVAVQADG